MKYLLLFILASGELRTAEVAFDLSDDCDRAGRATRRTYYCIPIQPKHLDGAIPLLRPLPE